jgi:predicted transcriptional regulator
MAGVSELGRPSQSEPIFAIGTQQTQVIKQIDDIAKGIVDEFRERAWDRTQTLRLVEIEKNSTQINELVAKSAAEDDNRLKQLASEIVQRVLNLITQPIADQSDDGASTTAQTLPSTETSSSSLSSSSSESGKLLQSETIFSIETQQEELIEQIGNISKGIIGEIQARVCAHAQKIICEIIGENSEREIFGESTESDIIRENSKIGRIFTLCYERHLAAIAEAFQNPDPQTCAFMVKTFTAAYELTKASLEAISRANVEIVKTGAIDRAFFHECTKQTGLIISQVNQLAIELAKVEDGRFKVIASELGQTVRRMVIEGKGLNQSLIPWAKSVSSRAVASSSAPGGVPAIEGPAAPIETSATALAAPIEIPTTAPVVETPTTSEQTGDGGGLTSSSSSSSRWD